MPNVRARRDRVKGKGVTLISVAKSCHGTKENCLARPEVMNGALVFAGTRVPVEILVDHLTAGDSLDKFLGDFPSVSREQAVAYLEMTLSEVEAA